MMRRNIRQICQIWKSWSCSMVSTFHSRKVSTNMSSNPRHLTGEFFLLFINFIQRFRELKKISYKLEFYLSPQNKSFTKPNIGLQFLARGLSISHEIRRISWNPYEIRMKSAGFHTDFMKSGGFHTDFIRISWNPVDFRWNPPKLKSFCWNIWIYKVLGGFHMKSAGFHEIHMKSGRFHEIWQISGEIHPNWRVFAETSEFIRFWVDFMVKSARFQVKSTRFYGEICQISNYDLLCDDQV